MANPPNRPPPQQQRPPQEQQRQKQQDKSAPRSREQSATNQRAEALRETKTGEDSQSGVVTEAAVVVEGAGGAKNLTTQWVDVWLPGGKPMYIIVNTLPSNDLAVSIEQRSWKKNYVAKGRVQTDVTPIAPIGTQGKLVAKDTTTGEELTINFSWGPIAGPSLLARLIKLVKGLFTSGKA
jgi:hypothetical protein